MKKRNSHLKFRPPRSSRRLFSSLQPCLRQDYRSPGHVFRRAIQVQTSLLWTRQGLNFRRIEASELPLGSTGIHRAFDVRRLVAGSSSTSALRMTTIMFISLPKPSTGVPQLGSIHEMYISWHRRVEHSLRGRSRRLWRIRVESIALGPHALGTTKLNTTKYI